MILVGNLNEFSKESIDNILDRLDCCYCLNDDTYNYFKQEGLIVDKAYWVDNYKAFVNNSRKYLLNENVVVSSSVLEKYIYQLKLLEKGYRVYVL